MNEEKASNREQAARAGSASFQRSLLDGVGFTLIELLVVVAVIAVLAGLTLAALGGVNQKAARDRTKAEVSALVNAMESYRSQRGAYPPADQKNYSGNVPYDEIATYMESFSGSVSNSSVVDPYGGNYIYLKPGLTNPASFDLYSTAGGTNNASWIGNW
jgi:general secretion pathway protein G